MDRQREERVALRLRERNQAHRELLAILGSQAMEVLMLIVGLCAIQVSIRNGTEHERWYRTVAIAAFVWVLIMFIGLVFLYDLPVLKTIRTDLKYGVVVKRGRGRIQRHGKTFLSTLNELDSESAQSTMDEFRLRNLRRKLIRIKRSCWSAFVQDLVIFLLSTYMLVYSPAVIYVKVENNDTKDWDNVNLTLPGNTTSPLKTLIVREALGLSGGLTLFLVLSSAFMFVYKLSNFRVRPIVIEAIAERELVANKNDRQDLSPLDRFQENQVSEKEINLVLQIRRMVESTQRVPLREALDLFILRELRRANGDVLEATARLTKYLAWRKASKVEEFRKDILGYNMGWRKLPHMEVLLSKLPIYVSKNIDERRSALVVYAYCGANVDLSGLFELLARTQCEVISLFMAEWLKMLLNRASVWHGVLLKLRFLVNFQPGNAEVCNAKDEELFVQILANVVLPAMDMYGFEMEFLWWDAETSPSVQLQQKANFIKRLCGINPSLNSSRTLAKVMSVSSFQDLAKLISTSFIPRQIGGSLLLFEDFDAIEISSDPWNLRRAESYEKLSEYVGGKGVTELVFFKGVTKRELKRVTRVLHWLAIAWKDELTTKLQDQNQLIVYVKFKEYMTRLKMKQLTIENFSIEATGSVTIHRYARAAKESLEAAWLLARSLHTRYKHSMDEISKDIISNDLRISDLIHFNLLKEAGVIPLLDFDAELGRVVLFVSLAKLEKFDLQLNSQRLMQGVYAVAEFMFILCDVLSRRLEKLVSIQVVGLAQQNLRISKLKEVHNLFAEVGHMYPPLISLPLILLSKNPSVRQQATRGFLEIVGMQDLGTSQKVISLWTSVDAHLEILGSLMDVSRIIALLKSFDESCQESSPDFFEFCNMPLSRLVGSYLKREEQHIARTSSVHLRTSRMMHLQKSLHGEQSFSEGDLGPGTREPTSSR